jgi:glycosyltransferase involved in cell wall biosynthesis
MTMDYFPPETHYAAGWRQRAAAIIPCLNEVATIKRLVFQVKEHVDSVCVVDDGSRDGTADAASRSAAHVIRFPVPGGKGKALRAGWRWAMEQGLSWALSLDGDGQHIAQEIPRFFRMADQTGALLVVGNRMGEAAKIPICRRLVNRWMSWRLSGVVGQTLPDSQCGFRLMNLGALSKLSIATGHFEIESEVLVAFSRAGCPIEFVPVSVIYRTEKSKIRPIRDSIRWFRWLRLVESSAAATKAPVELGTQPLIAQV